jgi:hypothetical protein
LNTPKTIIFMHLNVFFGGEKRTFQKFNVSTNNIICAETARY